MKKNRIIPTGPKVMLPAFLIVVVILVIVLFPTISSAVETINNYTGRTNSSNDSTSSGKAAASLAVPTNVKYNEKTNYLYWDKVDNATGYYVSINDEIVKEPITQNKYYFVTNKKEISFKVQAYDSNYTYKDSSWSSDCRFSIYNIKEASKGTIFSFIATFVEPNKKLLDVYEFFYHNKEIRVAALFENKDGAKSINNYIVEYNESFYSFETALKKDKHVSFDTTYIYKEYDSINYYLQSDVLCEDLQTFKDDDYKLSVIKSVAYEYAGSSYVYTRSIIKFQKDEDIKYYNTVITFNPGSTTLESTKYTKALVNIYDSKVHCRQFREETDDDMLAYIHYLEEEKQLS